MVKNKFLIILSAFFTFSVFSSSLAGCTKTSDIVTEETSALEVSSDDAKEKAENTEVKENEEFLKLLDNIKNTYGKNKLDFENYILTNSGHLDESGSNPKGGYFSYAYRGDFGSSPFSQHFTALFANSYTISGLYIRNCYKDDSIKSEDEKKLSDFKQKLNETGITPAKINKDSNWPVTPKDAADGLRWECNGKFIEIYDDLCIHFGFMSDSELEEENKKDIPDNLKEQEKNKEKPEAQYNSSLDSFANPSVSLENCMMAKEFNYTLANYKNMTYNELVSKLNSENITYKETDNNSEKKLFDKEIRIAITNYNNINGLKFYRTFLIKDNFVYHSSFSFSAEDQEDQTLNTLITNETNSFLHYLSVTYGNPSECEGCYYFVDDKLSIALNTCQMYLNYEKISKKTLHE